MNLALPRSHTCAWPRPAIVAMRDSSLLLSLKKKYISASRQLRCVYVSLCQCGVQLYIRFGKRRDHALA